MLQAMEAARQEGEGNKQELLDTRRALALARANAQVISDAGVLTSFQEDAHTHLSVC